jgi:hypothetical protein
VLCGDETEEEFTQRGLPHVLYLRPPVRRDHEDEVESAREEKLSSWQMRARYSQ